ncbi:GNAT family N-acetyltransferase [Halohasta salina]|uniref:GNAT family N-acetyltransferase n=1 Tax=Halohasta salina TaxID=2961621 RepID=UPI0020A4E557|nr:GNAT family N-acetyltransferase [Halohasta salina]
MPNCDGCELPTSRQKSKDNEAETLCGACTELREGTPSVWVSPLESRELELVLAWRSHPEVYANFRQQDGPLTWDEHVSWFESRDTDRYDFIIHFDGRRVGAININQANEVGIFLGDFSAGGHGVATVTVEWLCQRFDYRAPLYAEVHDENQASKRLFKRCGFQQRDADSDWIEYVYDP